MSPLAYFLVFVVSLTSLVIWYLTKQFQEENITYSNNILNKFCLKRYDVLINYYDRNFLPMKLVSLRCNTKINVGFPNVDHKLNDLILNIDINDSLLFLSEVEKYLKLIHNGFKKEN